MFHVHIIGSLIYSNFYKQSTTDVPGQTLPLPGPVINTGPKKLKNVSIVLDNNNTVNSEPCSCSSCPPPERTQYANFINKVADLITGAKKIKEINEQNLSNKIISFHRYKKNKLFYDGFMPTNATKATLQGCVEDSFDMALKSLSDNDKTNEKMIVNNFVRILFEQAQKIYLPRNIKATEVFTEEEIAELAKARKNLPFFKKLQELFHKNGDHDKDYNELQESYEEYDKHDFDTCIDKYLESPEKWRDCNLQRYVIGNSSQDYINLIKNIGHLMDCANDGSLSL